MTYKYVSIDEGYAVHGIKNLEQVFIECYGLFLRDGSVIVSARQVRELLRKGDINLYEYDEDDLDAIHEGSIVRKDWQTKIVKL